jgi:lipopolysaccharide export system protein LptA
MEGDGGSGGTRITDVALDGPDGGRLVARSVTIPPGSKMLTLEGDVDASQNGMALHADHVVVVRGAEGRLESVTATPAVTGTAAGLTGGAAGFAAQEARVAWDGRGRVVSFGLSGAARIQHARGSIAAGEINAKALEAPGETALDAATEVVVSGTTPKGVGNLSCDGLHATIDAKGIVRDALASGSVRFDGEGAAGEAAEARFTALDAEGSVELLAADGRRARLASGRTRIVADHIATDIRGNKLSADGRVESLMLPASGPQTSHASPMFNASDSVHFVSASLESTNSGARLLLRGDVRGWQGDRTLSADEVEMIQAGDVLNASGHVATRMPRASARLVTEADYVQVGADKLEYRGAARSAEYRGSVRVRQAEGWLETPRLTAALAEGGPGLREIQALEGVRFEYRAAGAKGVPTTAAGDGDRAIYDAVLRVLRVFGDKGPATVRSTGPNGGTTVGRVLRYEMDTGALEVESGERDRATIRTQKN